MNSEHEKAGLISAVALGVGSVVGSGWLFASYYASKEAGGLSVLTWIIGAFIALLLAFLLAEIATMFQIRSLTSRLLSISHNKDLGFVIAISNWLGLVFSVPSEASATVQYLSAVNPNLEHYFFFEHQLTYIGILCVCGLVFVYGFLNYWGIKSLAKATNVLTALKIIIPISTAIILFYSSFDSSNFTAYKGEFAPYGISSAFTAVVTCGVFYSFYGFSSVAVFATELKNPKKNIPLALILTVLICLVIYLLLQTSFIGALPQDIANNISQNGWGAINFTSPLAQLLILLNINFWAIVLYIDAAASPSGTAIIYTGSASRMLTGMSHDRQAPKFFDKLHPIYNLSRRSLIFSCLMCCCLVIFFQNWQEIMIVVTVFYLMSCMAIPLAFSKLRKKDPNRERIFRFKGGEYACVFSFIVITYLLTQAGYDALLLSLIMHLVFFFLYSFSFYKLDFKRILQSFLSSWTMFVYLAVALGLGILNDYHKLNNIYGITLMLVSSLVMYYLILNQKDHTKT